MCMERDILTTVALKYQLSYLVHICTGTPCIMHATDELDSLSYEIMLFCYSLSCLRSRRPLIRSHYGETTEQGTHWDSINSASLSVIEILSSFRGFQRIIDIRKVIFETSNRVLFREI